MWPRRFSCRYKRSGTKAALKQLCKTKAPDIKQFLIVDDDPGFLSTAASQLKGMSAGRWIIHTATNHSHALEQLKTQPVDTIVLDVEMPVMDGIEFLRLLNRSHPGQQVVMLARRMDEATRKTCLDLGAALFLEKPGSSEEFRALFAALDSLSGAAPQSGFRGVMQRVGLEDVLQMECLARKSSILVVSTGNRRGEIYICDGEIIHAQTGQLQGEMALYGLLALPGGQFTLQPFAEPARRTISGQYQFLLMEAARLRDEAGDRPGQQARRPWARFGLRRNFIGSSRPHGSPGRSDRGAAAELLRWGSPLSVGMRIH